MLSVFISVLILIVLSISSCDIPGTGGVDDDSRQYTCTVDSRLDFDNISNITYIQRLAFTDNYVFTGKVEAYGFNGSVLHTTFRSDTNITYIGFVVTRSGFNKEFYFDRNDTLYERPNSSSLSLAWSHITISGWDNVWGCNSN